METKQIVLPRIITNGFCVARPQYIFLYGYDVQDKSWGGQSLIHGNKNTFPIPVMYKFCNSGARYFTDADSSCIGYIDLAFSRLPLHTIIIPLRKMGEGCSRLKELAPRTFAYLQKELKAVAYPNIKWDYNSVLTHLY